MVGNKKIFLLFSILIVGGFGPQMAQAQWWYTNLMRLLQPITTTTSTTTTSLTTPSRFQSFFSNIFKNYPSILSTTTTKSPCNDVILNNQCLSPGDTFYSCNGCFKFVFQFDGNAVVYKNSNPQEAIWSTNTFNKGATKMCLQQDNNFVIYRDSTPLWASNTNSPVIVNSAIVRIQDDGSLVLLVGSTVKYSSGKTSSCPTTPPLSTTESIFQTPVTEPPATETDPPFTETETLSPTTEFPVSFTTLAPCGVISKEQCLYPGDSIFSCNGCFNFTLQVDGNLVIYKNSVPSQAIWATATDNKGSTRLCMQKDNNFVLYKQDSPLWASNTYLPSVTGFSYAKIQDNGQLIVVVEDLVKYSSDVTSSCPTDTPNGPLTTESTNYQTEVTNTPASEPEIIKTEATQTDAPPTPPTNLKPFLCYLPSYGRSQYDVSPCTHVSYAFFDVTSDGDIFPVGIDSSASFIELKKNNANKKFLISIGGYNYGKFFATVASSSSLRQTLANKILLYIENNGLDGVDIDWEYPDDNAGNFVALLQSIYEILHPKGYLVTIAVGARTDSPIVEGRYDVPNIDKYVDFINLMTYDYYGKWNTATGLHGSFISSDITTEYWSMRVASSQKLLLGIPFYGKGWILSNPNNNGINANVQFDTGFDITYPEICKRIKNNGYTRVFDTDHNTPYVYGEGQWIGYDDVQSIQVKVDYVKKQNLGGVFVWEITQDDIDEQCGEGKYPLTNAIKKYLNALS